MNRDETIAERKGRGDLQLRAKELGFNEQIMKWQTIIKFVKQQSSKGSSAKLTCKGSK